MNAWSSLEHQRGLNAVPAVWREKIGSQFDTFSRAFLQISPQPAECFPCRKCGCAHEIILCSPEDSPLPSDGRGVRGEGIGEWRGHGGRQSERQSGGGIEGERIIAVCTCEPWNCHHLLLSPADIQILELNWAKLARALCQAFGLDSKPADFGLRNTRQIGSWSTETVPVILTIQHERRDFQQVVMALTARLRQKFILLSPTSANLDAVSQELLARDGAGFFALDAHVLLTDQGTLEPRRNPAELFAPFTPPAAGPTQTQQSRAREQAATPHASRLTLHASLLTPHVSPPRYSLRKGHGLWKLTFDGQEAEMKHEQGIFYVAYLLANPPSQPIHALDVAAKIPGIYRRHLGLTEIIDPATGKAAALESHARLQERSLGLDDAAAVRAVLRKQQELEAILDDDDESEPVKAEALRELEAIAEFQRKHGRRTEDNAQKAAKAVRKAIRRFHQRLLRAVDASGNPHQTLRAFAAHLEKHLLVPSVRFSRPGGPRASTGLAGCLTYEPPPGVKWAS